MNPELSKQLKAAGFTGAKYQQCWKDHYHIKECEYLPSPTLSELIEACGSEFAALHKTFSGWLADAKYKTETGSTPVEAVAHLWLALNAQP